MINHDALKAYAQSRTELIDSLMEQARAEFADSGLHYPDIKKTREALARCRVTLKRAEVAIGSDAPTGAETLRFMLTEAIDTLLNAVEVRRTDARAGISKNKERGHDQWENGERYYEQFKQTARSK